MNKALTIFFILLFILPLSAQDDWTKLTQPIVEEGKRLYQSEMASWFGTDIFLAKYENKERVSGYFSYPEEKTTKCIFFSNDSIPMVLGTIEFDATFDVDYAFTSLKERPFTPKENDLYQIRKVALESIKGDTLFKYYDNTNFNLIPLIHNNEKKVYVLTGPEVTGVVVFGNDYLITFDEDNKVTSKRALHKNIIPIYYGEEHNEGKEVESTMHSHLPETGEFITATDICTLMLYGKYTDWKNHIVVSKEYYNQWNCETNELTVLPMETIRKINEDQEKRKKKEKKQKRKKKRKEKE